MTNLVGGLATGGTTSSVGGTTGGTTPTTQPDLTGLLTDLGSGSSSPLTGGTDTGLISSAAFNPTLYEPGGLFSPTGTQQPAAPAAQEAQQDPSGQVPTSEQLDRTAKADRATTQDQPTTRSAGGDQAQQPAGPTGLGGDQTGNVRQSGLAKLAQALAGPQAQRPTPQQAPAPPPAAAPQPAGAPPAQPAEPAGGRTAPSQPVPGAQPTAATGAAPAGMTGAPPLIQGILNAIRALGGLPPQGGPQPLANVAGQAYPQREFTPVSPTAGLGPYARARMRANPGKYEQPTQDEWTRNVSAGGALGPAPGTDAEVSAPTDQQARQGRLAGTDTPPTAGFSPVLERERAKFRNELNNPRTRWETLAMMALEHDQDPAAVAESLLNRSDYAKSSVHNMLHSGFYGPVNFGKLGAEIRRLQNDPQRAARLNAGLETALRGSNLLGGATDQGSHRDPNVGWRGGRVIRFGETYNDWGGGPGGHAGAERYRKQQQQRVRAGQQAAERGQQFAMDISRRVPFTGGAEMDIGGGMIRRGAPATELENITEQRRRRELEQQRARAGVVS